MSKRITAGTGISLGALLALPAAAQGDDFTVTNLNDSGAGSLREAIEDANANTTPDRILFDSKLTGTIDASEPAGLYPALYIGNSGPGDSVEIIGPGARQLTVSGGDDEIPVFVTVASYGGNPPIDVAISGLRITDGGDSSFFSPAGDGGGILSIGDVDLTLSRVTISGNRADGSGGGIAAIPYMNEAGSLTVESSTISGNSTPPNEDGGGIYTDRVDVSIRNSTISGNTSGDEAGGILAFYTGSNPSTFELRNSTVADNESVQSGGGIFADGAGNTWEIRGSIVAGNTSGDDPDLAGSGPWHTSFSLIGDTDGADITDGGGNLLDVDPDLLGLANNGGPTNTHALAKGSPAINAGPSDAPGSDQRGAPRKGQPDIGAYEFAKCAGVLVNVVGTEGKDKLKGTSGKDGILGLKGKDKLSGKGKKDGLCGAGGKDKLKGGPGKDKLKGGPGKDKLIGGPGKDKLVGGPGKDKEIQ